MLSNVQYTIKNPEQRRISSFYAMEGGVFFDEVSIRVLTAVRKDIADKVILENRSDLADHPYYLIIDVKELCPRTRKSIQRTRVVNMYDNIVGQGHTWQGHTTTIQRAIQDIQWNNILQGRVLLLGDMNAHSLSWNLHCTRRQNAGPLEDLMDRYELIVNNDTDYPTRPRSQGISIINLAPTTASLGPLTLGEIPEEYPSVSDHELILLQWEDLRQSKNQSEPAINTGWNIQPLMKNEAALCIAKKE